MKSEQWERRHEQIDSLTNKLAERGMALGMDLSMEIPGIPLTIFQANGHHAAGVWLFRIPVWLSSFFLSKVSFFQFS